MPPAACAATPVKSAGATSPEKRTFQALEPCSSARSPKRNAAIGSRGTRSSCAAREVDDAALPREQRRDEAAPRRPVGAEPLDRAVEVAPRDAGPPAGQRMRVRRLGHDPLGRVRAVEQAELAEHRRREPRRMHRRAHVVAESRQRELGGANAPADRRRGLEHAHAAGPARAAMTAATSPLGPLPTTVTSTTDQ